MRFLLLLPFLLFPFGISSQNECGPASGFTGTFNELFPNGSKQEENSYFNGVKHGICLSFYLDGSLRSKRKYQLGKLVETLQEPNAAHDLRDYNILHPAPAIHYSNNAQHSNEPSDWLYKETRLNDSVMSSHLYWKKQLFRERTLIHGDLRYERMYRIESPGYETIKETNINYEAHKYHNQVHGKVTSWYDNGNINFRNEYRHGEPTGVHYRYYNEAKHRLRSITFYTDPDETGDEYTSKISALTKHYDTTGILTGYDVSYGGRMGISEQVNRALKKVSFTAKAGVHTWEASATYAPDVVVQGTIENGYYRISSITTKDGKKTLVKDGNGKYDHEFGALTDVVFQIPDTVSLPQGLGTHSQWRIIWPEQNLVGRAEDYFLGYQSAGYDYQTFALPGQKWKGKIKDGFLTGPWKMEGSGYLRNNMKLKVSYEGNFEKSRRTGLWTYETDLYTYTVNYINGKKEGMLKAELKPYDKARFKTEEGYPYKEPGDKFPEVYHNVVSLWTGNYVNNEMQGEWLVYYRYPDLLAFKAVFNQGVLVAKTEEYNLKQQLVTKRELSGNKVAKETLYTPFGEAYDKKFLDEHYGMTTPFLMEKNAEGEYHGRHLRWNNYTGQVFEKGTYIHGHKNGEWYVYSSGDTTIRHYTNDTLDGFFKNDNRIYDTWHILQAGSYSKGKKSGLWKHDDTRDSLFTEEVFMDDEQYLMTYISKNKVCVKQGEGIIRKMEHGIASRLEEHYKNGRVFKTVIYHTQTDQIESIVYTGTHGDSLAYYMPRESGTCVKNGTGMRTYFDGKKRIYRIDYYVAGKLIKHDRYNEGSYQGTDYFHYVSDTTSHAKDQLFFAKDVTRRANEYEFTVTLTVKNIPKNTVVIYVDDQNDLLAHQPVISEPEHFTVRRMNNSMELLPKKLPLPNEVTITYKIPIDSKVSGQAGILLYADDSKKQFSLSCYYPVRN